MESTFSQNTTLFSFKKLIQRLKMYLELTKPRLTFLVIFSSVCGYYMATSQTRLDILLPLIVGGYLITGASNTFNQIIEKETDKLMLRTEKRPLPSERMSTIEALIFSFVLTFLGLFLLFYYVNPLSGWLGLLSMVLYVLVYTPMKKRSPLGVFVGAFPGAIPPMLGYISVSGSFGLEPGLLFAVQFIWQFPHFWAIAWKSHDDYERAGLKMLPLPGGKTNHNAFYVLLYTLFTLPIGYLVYHFEICGPWYLAMSIILGLFFSYKAYVFYKHKNDEKALNLMFSSFIYLPLIQLSMIFDKL